MIKMKGIVKEGWYERYSERRLINFEGDYHKIIIKIIDNRVLW
jgi:hypothetical protein